MHIILVFMRANKLLHLVSGEVSLSFDCYIYVSLQKGVIQILPSGKKSADADGVHPSLSRMSMDFWIIDLSKIKSHLEYPLFMVAFAHIWLRLSFEALGILYRFAVGSCVFACTYSTRLHHQEA